MTADEIRHLQRGLRVGEDGIMGPGTLTALFAAMGAPAVRASELGLAGSVHMRSAGILGTPLRLAHFMAQVAHESGGFRYMEEIASGSAYEGRKDLGNVVAGDGKRYKGRGPLQLTGRANYRRVGRAIGIDLESHPEIAAYPSVGLWIACVYWTDRGLNDLADRDDLTGITKRVNGGLNGYADRQERYANVRGLVMGVPA